MRKVHKIILSVFFLVMILAYNNCGQVQFSQAPATVNGAAGSQPPTSVIVPLNTASQIAYEDLEDQSSPDYDYNDFLTEFVVNETPDSTGKYITDIYLDFYPRAVGAGDDHEFILSLTGNVSTAAKNNTATSPLPSSQPLFNGSATVSVTYYDSTGQNVTSTESNVPYTKDIVLFSSTHGIFGSNYAGLQINTCVPTTGCNSNNPTSYIDAQQLARVHISLATPSANPYTGTFNSALLRAVLYNINTNVDIDTINANPTNFVASTGFPWAFVIPTTWQWMQEGSNIINGYNPMYADYANFLLTGTGTGDYLHWFDYPVTGAAAAEYLYPIVPFTPSIAVP